MRIAIYHNLPSGGAKRALYEQIKRLSKDNEFDLYTLKGSGSENFMPLDKFIKNKYSENFIIVKNRFTPDFIKQIIRLFSINYSQKVLASRIDQKDYDLVYIHHCMYTQSPLVLKFLKSKTIYYVQEPRRRSYEESLIPKYYFNFNIFKTLRSIVAVNFNKVLTWQDKKSIHKANKLLCNSEFSKNRIKKCYNLNANVCYLGVDFNQFRPLHIKMTNSILSVGALHPIKGHEDIISALSKIEQSNRPKLEIVYDRANDGYVKVIKDIAKSLKVEMNLHQGIQDKELIKFYNSTICTVAAAYQEPFGFTPLESIACGKPVIARFQGGYKETVKDKNNGLFFSDTKGLRDRIIEIIEKDIKFDMNQSRAAMSDNWSWESSCKNLQKIFEASK